MGIKVALAQTNSWVGAVGLNLQQVLDWSARAVKEHQAEVVVFPEMMLAGYPPEDLAYRPEFQRENEHALHRLARDLLDEGLGSAAVVVGYLGASGIGEPMNSVAVLRDGEIEVRYHKHSLPNYGVFDERRVFVAGDRPAYFEANGHRFGLAVCEDIWTHLPVMQRYAALNVDALLVLNASPYEQGKRGRRTKAAHDTAHSLQVPLAYVNAVGGQDDLVFDGASFVIDQQGAVLGQHAAFEEGLLIWDVEGEACQNTHITNSSSIQETYEALTLGLRDYVRKNGFGKVVLGVSGGIDSALVATIAADALGGENVVGISMPSKFSSAGSLDDAEDLMRRLGGEYQVRSIEPMFDVFQAENELTGTAAENLQARIRGVILMGESNTHNWLVLAPGNKTELAVGYSTIYGDTVGGFAPLKDVSKTLVWKLARWRNEHARLVGEQPPIPERSIEKPPSAELSVGQVDQDALPEYAVLDEFLNDYLVAGEEVAFLEGKYGAEMTSSIIAMINRSEWKRRQYPLGTKITATAFGKDRRVPVTHRRVD